MNRSFKLYKNITLGKNIGHSFGSYLMSFSEIFFGIIDPVNTLGKENDLFFNKQNKTLFIKKKINENLVWFNDGIIDSNNSILYFNLNTLFNSWKETDDFKWIDTDDFKWIDLPIQLNVNDYYFNLFTYDFFKYTIDGFIKLCTIKKNINLFNILN